MLAPHSYAHQSFRHAQSHLGAHPIPPFPAPYPPQTLFNPPPHSYTTSFPSQPLSGAYFTSFWSPQPPARKRRSEAEDLGGAQHPLKKRAVEMGAMETPPKVFGRLLRAEDLAVLPVEELQSVKQNAEEEGGLEMGEMCW